MLTGHGLTRLFALVIVGCPSMSTAVADAQQTARTDEARQLLASSGLSGGLIVHVGCTDGKLTAALGAEGNYLVQGLDVDAKNVDDARAYVRSRGQYGRVSIDRLTGQRLPYANDLVNLLVAERRPSNVGSSFMTRSSRPGPSMEAFWFKATWSTSPPGDRPISTVACTCSA